MIDWLRARIRRLCYEQCSRPGAAARWQPTECVASVQVRWRSVGLSKCKRALVEYAVGCFSGWRQHPKGLQIARALNEMFAHSIVLCPKD